jgi:hypothetical protein
MRLNLLMLAAAAVCGGASGALLHEPRSAAANTPTYLQQLPVAAARPPAPVRRHPMLRAARAVLSSVGIEDGARRAEVQTALDRLGGVVREQSDPSALRMAFRAYFNFKAAHPDEVRKPYLYFVDYGLDSRTPRGYVFDMQALRLLDGPFTVAHGRGSESGSGVPTRFSNRQRSNATSLGLFLAQEVYPFVGHSNGRSYRSLGLRLRGVSGSFNNAARARGVVVHGAPYVTRSRAGRSEGCPAMEPERARELIPRIGNGGLVFLFSPRDHSWLRQDPWANDGVG